MRNIAFILILFLFSECSHNTEQKLKVQTKSPIHSFILSKTFASEKDTTIDFLWLKKVWDEELRDTIEQIEINKLYADTVSKEIKLAIAYASLYAGSNCWWKGEEPNNTMTNLECVILSSISMGCQCSDEHLQPLQIAFAHDSAALLKIQDCAAIPNTATYQNTFTHISIQKSKNIITLYLKADFINARKQLIKPWEKSLIFEVSQKGIILRKEITVYNE
jgi:hypothetical protein